MPICFIMGVHQTHAILRSVNVRAGGIRWLFSNGLQGETKQRPRLRNEDEDSETRSVARCTAHGERSTSSAAPQKRVQHVRRSGRGSPDPAFRDAPSHRRRYLLPLAYDALVRYAVRRETAIHRIRICGECSSIRCLTLSPPLTDDVREENHRSASGTHAH